jgi:hypothetical protein
VPAKIVTAKVAAVALVGTFGLGSAAAAAVHALPGQSDQRSPHQSRPLINTVTSSEVPEPAPSTANGASTPTRDEQGPETTHTTATSEPSPPTSTATDVEGIDDQADNVTEPDEGATSNSATETETEIDDQPTVPTTPPTSEAETNRSPAQSSPEGDGEHGSSITPTSTASSGGGD